MKMPRGKPRSTRKLSIDEQAAERLSRAKPVGSGDRVFEERERPSVHHIASSRSHRNPFAS
jgi:hypothetical protein